MASFASSVTTGGAAHAWTNFHALIYSFNFRKCLFGYKSAALRAKPNRTHCRWVLLYCRELNFKGGSFTKEHYNSVKFWSLGNTRLKMLFWNLILQSNFWWFLDWGSYSFGKRKVSWFFSAQNTALASYCKDLQTFCIFEHV